MGQFSFLCIHGLQKINSLVYLPLEMLEHASSASRGFKMPALLPLLCTVLPGWIRAIFTVQVLTNQNCSGLSQKHCTGKGEDLKSLDCWTGCSGTDGSTPAEVVQRVAWYYGVHLFFFLKMWRNVFLNSEFFHCYTLFCSVDCQNTFSSASEAPILFLNGVWVGLNLA